MNAAARSQAIHNIAASTARKQIVMTQQTNHAIADAKLANTFERVSVARTCRALPAHLRAG